MTKSCVDPSPAETCQLTCLEQPRFFCGQLLTDQDLMALVNWTQDKSRLKRFRDGWGVVFGLSVRCDPQCPSGIVVGSGYAVTRSGDDVIICQEAALDLIDECRLPQGPCRDLTAARADKTEQYHVVDIYLRYQPHETRLRAALNRRGCGSMADCEPSRVLEGYELIPLPVKNGRETAFARRWKEDFNACREVLTYFEDQLGDRDWTGSALRRVFLDWIENHPPRHFCFLRDWLCSEKRLPDEVLGQEGVCTLLLLLLIQECRDQFLLRCGWIGGEDCGVPLARVVLQTQDETGRPLCKVRAINSYPPYRRWLATDYWPALPGHVNLARALWQSVGMAYQTLADFNIQLRAEPFGMSFAALHHGFDGDLIPSYQNLRPSYVMYYLDYEWLVKYGLSFLGEDILRSLEGCVAFLCAEDMGGAVSVPVKPPPVVVRPEPAAPAAPAADTMGRIGAAPAEAEGAAPANFSVLPKLTLNMEQKLHALGITTFVDLADWLETAPSKERRAVVGSVKVEQVQAWIQEARRRTGRRSS